MGRPLKCPHQRRLPKNRRCPAEEHSGYEATGGPPVEAQRGSGGAGDGHQELAAAGELVQRLRAAEGVLPAAQHLPAAPAAPAHALQAGPRAAVQAPPAQPPGLQGLPGCSGRDY